MLPQPSLDNLLCTFIKCTEGSALVDASHLHAFTRICGLDTHASLGNCLLSVLTKAGSMHNAQRVFDRLPSRSKPSWNCIILGYLKHGEFSQAFTLYQKMQAESVRLHVSTFVALLRAC
eukprot:c8345_g1_i1 orf=1-354(-)